MSEQIDPLKDLFEPIGRANPDPLPLFDRTDTKQRKNNDPE